MAYCPDFAYDVFISYSHVNNAKLGTEDQGWVTDLHDVLLIKLVEKLSKKVTIWRDRDGLDGRTIDDGIRAALENSAVFLAIMSSGFLKSSYTCPVELAGFKHPHFPLVVRTHSRLIVAACESEQEAPRDTWPAALRGVPCVPFAEPGAGPYARTARYDPLHAYWARVDKLTRHIVLALSEVAKGLNGEEVSKLTTPEVVVSKPATWQKRWLKPRVHITYLKADRHRADQLIDQLKDRCDVTFLPADDADDRRQRRYLENSDGQILLFDCAHRPWAEDQVLQSIDVSAAQGRPRRLALVTDDVCLNDFAIRSDFVVPVGPLGQAQAFVASLSPA